MPRTSKRSPAQAERNSRPRWIYMCHVGQLALPRTLSTAAERGLGFVQVSYRKKRGEWGGWRWLPVEHAENTLSSTFPTMPFESGCRRYGADSYITPFATFESRTAGRRIPNLAFLTGVGIDIDVDIATAEANGTTLRIPARRDVLPLPLALSCFDFNSGRGYWVMAAFREPVPADLYLERWDDMSKRFAELYFNAGMPVDTSVVGRPHTLARIPGSYNLKAFDILNRIDHAEKNWIPRVDQDQPARPPLSFEEIEELLGSKTILTMPCKNSPRGTSHPRRSFKKQPGAAHPSRFIADNMAKLHVVPWIIDRREECGELTGYRSNALGVMCSVMRSVQVLPENQILDRLTDVNSTLSLPLSEHEVRDVLKGFRRLDICWSWKRMADVFGIDESEIEIHQQRMNRKWRQLGLTKCPVLFDDLSARPDTQKPYHGDERRRRKWRRRHFITANFEEIGKLSTRSLESWLRSTRPGFAASLATVKRDMRYVRIARSFGQLLIQRIRRAHDRVEFSRKHGLRKGTGIPRSRSSSRPSAPSGSRTSSTISSPSLSTSVVSHPSPDAWKGSSSGIPPPCT